MGIMPLWDEPSVYNASLMVDFAIKVAIIIFVGIRLLYDFGDTTPKSSLLFALNLTRLLFLFVSAIISGPASLDRNRFTFIPPTIIFIIILFLTSFKIEYPPNSGTVNVTAVGHVPAGSVDTAHVPAGF